MAVTYEPIATTTLTTSTATVTFSSIPSTYTDLILVCQVSTVTAGEQPLLTFNNNTSNYSYTYLYGQQTSTGTSRLTNSSYIKVNNGSLRVGFDNVIIINVMNYANTSVNKSLIYRSGNATTIGNEVGVGLWNDTTAINRLDMKQTGSIAYATGSVFTLYGIKAA